MSMNNRQQKIQSALAALNVTGRASEVFFVLLKQGTASAARIAKHIRDIPRTSIYDILKNLQHHGLVSSFSKGKETLFSVENIEHAVDVLEEQKRDLTEKQNSIRAVADLLTQFKTGTIYQPSLRYFEGKQGILAIHREIQNARHPTRTIVDIESVYKAFPQMLSLDNLKDFQTYQIEKKDLIIKTRSAERYLKVAPISTTHHVKWLPPEMHFKTDTLIWSGHVAIIDYADKFSGIVIDNPTIADTFVAWFEMMWGNINEAEVAS